MKLLEAGSEYPLSKHFSLESPISDNISKEEQGSRPDTVTNAMKVLEVHEKILEKSLDSDEMSDDLGDGEKALVREMCNVSSSFIFLGFHMMIYELLSHDIWFAFWHAADKL